MTLPALIVLDGPDGTGKSTLVNSLVEEYRRAQRRVIVRRDPGSTLIGERVREMVLDPETEMCPAAQMFAFLAARAELLEDAADYLKRGDIVILDRLWASTLAYQGWAQGMGEQIVLDTAEFQLNKLIPPLVPIYDVFLSASQDNRKHRLAETGKKPDRFEGQNAEFYRLVDHGYARAVELAPGVSHHIHHVIEVDANYQPHDVLNATMNLLHKHNSSLPQGY